LPSGRGCRHKASLETQTVNLGAVRSIMLARVSALCHVHRIVGVAKVDQLRIGLRVGPCESDAMVVFSVRRVTAHWCSHSAPRIAATLIIEGRVAPSEVRPRRPARPRSEHPRSAKPTIPATHLDQSCQSPMADKCARGGFYKSKLFRSRQINLVIGGGPSCIAAAIARGEGPKRFGIAPSVAVNGAPLAAPRRLLRPDRPQGARGQAGFACEPV